MRTTLTRAGFALLLSAITTAAGAAGIEGAAERSRFTPGDQTLYQTELARCPVGEFLDEWEIAGGAYECARFRDRIWIRPLERDTALYLRLPRPLPREFSLEFPVWIAEPGCAFVQFTLTTAKSLAAVERDPHALLHNVLIGGQLSCSQRDSLFGASPRPRDLHLEFRARLTKDRIHHVAVQVRRKQVRFFVDGRQIAHRPFRPSEPIVALGLHFARHFDTPEPYAKAPALVGDIRIATYSKPEAVPTPEQDLIRELGAVHTPEGLKITLSEAVLFDFGQWALKPEARPTLEKLAKLASLRDGPVRVEGHTDDVGPRRFNQVLSELRAYVVALDLARLGVDPRRLQPKGFGETRPLVPNDSDAHRARNRRVEVLLAKG